MKRISLILVTILVVIMFTGCGKSDSPKAVVGEMLDSFDSYISDMNSASNADDVVSAMDKFAAAMTEIAPRMKALQEKYPELKGGMKNGQMPEAFKEYEGRFKEMMPKMMGLAGKMMQYMKDPKVQEAMKKFQASMNALK